MIYTSKDFTKRRQDFQVNDQANQVIYMDQVLRFFEMRFLKMKRIRVLVRIVGSFALLEDYQKWKIQ